MKFTIGDVTDSAHCRGLQHECLRCHDAFKEFTLFATLSLANRQDRWLSYKAHNAYSNFILHLYEFLLAAYVRDHQNTSATEAKGSHDATDAYINQHAQRILTGKRSAIMNGTAPEWENQLSAYPENIPTDLAKRLRRVRNKIAGHVTHERSSLSLSAFFSQYHLFLHMLYRESISVWLPRELEFPDLKEITDFSIALSESPSI